MYPRDPSRIPSKSYVEKGSSPNARVASGGSPIPTVTAVDVNPVSIVVCYVSKGFVGDPAVITIPCCPPPYRKRTPVGRDMQGAPERAVSSLVVDTFPYAIFFEGIRFVVKLFREIVC
jgi:hypothetical protein